MNPADLVGKDILVGKTFYEGEDQVVSQEQYHGDIVEVDSGKIVVRRRGDGGHTWIPLNLDAIRPAPGGTYDLASVQATVTNPTLLTSWRLWIRHSSEGEMYYEISPNYAPLRESKVPKEWEFTYSPNVDAFPGIHALFAREYVGRTVLLGITHLDAEGEVASKEQVVGTIVRVDAEASIVVESDSDGREIELPPDLALIEKAPPGRYRLHETGQTVEDPDYVAAFIFEPPEAPPN